MSAAALALEDGSRLALGERLGRGGEGDVYAIADDPHGAVKLYTVADLRDRGEKVRAMVRANLADRSELAAFPVAVVNRSGGFAGFTMRRVTGRKPLHELYSPGARKASFPRADYRFLVRTAANVARAVGAVHETGCVIGDINHSGILVSDTSTVALIDADSFQFTEAGRRHACRVGVPEYTPPELQGVALHSVERTVEHDRFGLAVVIFQLLFMGRHPFSGAYSSGEMPIERAIGEHRFAYSARRQVGMKPPPAVPTLVDIPPDVAAAFEAAFAPGSLRPDARSWTVLLAEMERSLRRCGSSALHHHSPAAATCPWCRMEAKQGVVLFMPHAPPGTEALATDAGGAGFNAAAAWSAIQAVPRPSPDVPEPRLPDLNPVATPAARAARQARRTRMLAGALALLAAIGTAVMATAYWPVWAGLGWLALAKLIGDDPATAALRKEKSELDRRFELALGIWREQASDAPFHKLVKELGDSRDTYVRLGEIQRRAVADYQNNRRGEQLSMYLDSFQLRRQKISGVGSGRLATLLAYGIETALDVTEQRILGVPGFGPKTAANLVAWKRLLEARFVYNERPNAADAAKMAAIRAETLRKEGVLRRHLLGGPAALSRVKAEIEARRHSPDQKLVVLHLQRSQLAADLA